MVDRKKQDIKFFWDRVDSVLGSSDEFPPELQKIIDSNLPEFSKLAIDAVFLSPSGEKFKVKYDDAGECARQIYAGLVDWFKNTLIGDEEELTSFANTEDINNILDEAKKLIKLSEKGARRDIFQSIKNLELAEKELEKVDKMIKDRTRGTRGMRRREGKQELNNLIMALIGVFGDAGAVYLVWEKAGYWAVIPGAILILLIVILVRTFKKWRKE